MSKTRQPCMDQNQKDKTTHKEKVGFGNIECYNGMFFFTFPGHI